MVTATWIIRPEPRPLGACKSALFELRAQVRVRDKNVSSTETSSMADELKSLVA